MCDATKTDVEGMKYMMSMPMDSEMVGVHNMTDENIGQLRNAMDEYMGSKFSTPGWKKHVSNCI